MRAMACLWRPALAALLWAPPAHADCYDGVGKLAAWVAHVSDPRLKALLQVDLHGAEIDLWELDEPECATKLAHAERLLATQQASLPAQAGN